MPDDKIDPPMTIARATDMIEETGLNPFPYIQRALAECKNEDELPWRLRAEVDMAMEES